MACLLDQLRRSYRQGERERYLFFGSNLHDSGASQSNHPSIHPSIDCHSKKKKKNSARLTLSNPFRRSTIRPSISSLDSEAGAE